MIDDFLAQRLKYMAAIAQRYAIGADEYTEATRCLAPIAQPVTLRKGEYLQRIGAPAQSVFWITEGVSRNGFFAENGAEVTLRFAVEGEGANAQEDVLEVEAGLPARHFIVAETALRGFRFDWSDVCRVRAQHAVVNDYYLKVLEYTLKRHARRTYVHSVASAQERLAEFRADYPGLEGRISQRVLASYLGITPSYLSQLLAREFESGQS